MYDLLFNVLDGPIGTTLLAGLLGELHLFDGPNNIPLKKKLTLEMKCMISILKSY